MVLSEAIHIDILITKIDKPDTAMLTGMLTVDETTDARGRCRFSVCISFNWP